MYTGVKQHKQKLNYKDRTEYLMIGQEETEINGYMRTKNVIRKKRFEADENLCWKDFEIVNLIASGAITELKPTQMRQSNETIARSAQRANDTIETIETINDIYGNESKEN